MECLKCSGQCVKNRCQSGRQRYKCKACGYQFVAERSRKPQWVKALGRLTTRGIARLLGVSAPAVLQWLRQEAPKPIQKPEAGDVEAIQFDEVRHFLGQKKRKLWVWLALDSDSK